MDLEQALPLLSFPEHQGTLMADQHMTGQGQVLPGLLPAVTLAPTILKTPRQPEEQ